MSVCWWCHWGWPKPIRDIYDEAVKMLGGDEHPMHYGPAHVVWNEENWDSAQWCLDHFDEFRGECRDEELAVIRWSLEQLLTIDETFKTEPKDYDEHHPENFPPPSHWVMVRS